MDAGDDVEVISFAATIRLNGGSTYRVNGVLHDYLGPTVSPDTGGLLHAFRRREWRPDTPDQLPVTLVPDAEVGWSVTRPGL